MKSEKVKSNNLFYVEKSLGVFALICMVVHISLSPGLLNQIIPKTAFEVILSMSFQSGGQDTQVSTYIPQGSNRQTVLKESSDAIRQEKLLYETPNGLMAKWIGNGEAKSIEYRAIVATTGQRFEISPELELEKSDPTIWGNYLQETPEIQVFDAEMMTVWQRIKPDESDNLLSVLTSIYQYVYQLDSLPLKGETDALTALRLEAASYNGKSRLFTALARQNGLPTRLVGGLILNTDQDQRTHQWVEVNIQNQWIPFDPTKGYFAEVPAHYLALYRGDMALFSHSNNINFEHQYTVQKKLVAPALYEEVQRKSESSLFNFASLLAQLNMPADTISVFLVLPFCALIITVLRNLIGLKSFGIFMPMLVGSVCAFVGILTGIVGFTLIVLIAWGGQIVMHKMKLLKIPRLAAIITIVNTVTILLLLFLDKYTTVQFGLLSLFPVIIISFIADKLHDLVENEEWQDLFTHITGSVVSIVLCYFSVTSATLHGLFALLPETFLLIFALQIYMGRWTGLRLNELLRFKKLIKNDKPVVGINARNHNLVAELNTKKDLKLAADKLATKKILSHYEIPIPGTIAEFKYFADMENLQEILDVNPSFVVKPNAGSQGNGILVISDTDSNGYITASGKRVTFADIQNLISEIICGNYSQLGDSDTAYLEPLIRQHQSIEDIAPYGLSDIRIVVIKGTIVSAMLRIPTTQSNGKANLHQGALGAAINLKTGVVERCLQKGNLVTIHPDSDKAIVGLQVPFWKEILEMSQRCSDAIALGYLGIDICLDELKGPLVLELNGRPGLEIQNVNDQGFPMQMLADLPANAH